MSFMIAHTTYYALLGAYNCDKTVFFNSLAGAHAKVANYSGVTVDKRESVFVDDKSVHIAICPAPTADYASLAWTRW